MTNKPDHALQVKVVRSTQYLLSVKVTNQKDPNDKNSTIDLDVETGVFFLTDMLSILKMLL